MPPLRREAWDSAALHLYEDIYSLITVGRRQHIDWHHDLLAIMTRTVEDPRGWSTLEWDIDTDERNKENPAFPFLSHTVEKLTTKLHEIYPDSASELLVAMTFEGYEIANIPTFAERKPGLLTEARTLISRFEPDFTCYTNLSDSQPTKHLESSRLVPHMNYGCMPLTEYTEDYGVVVVSDTEVGLFWFFNPI
ncbi:hypothetical protein [Streptomyces sp. H27-D2]|uniref:hypothetical protein n=1 Tax=Streptomyces sp. H27-D2 TaxID=3046304 RepID=UPI002DBA8C05|nr:hypothetical protein [Streptomyces sp. H27-D2]MEC4020545.1 hypothetical protein [Streptomyces sp. H27-D2]